VAILPSSGAKADGSTTQPAFKALVLPRAPQAPGLNFTAATLADTESSFPPDTMGVAGPSEFVIALNGRIRSFDKATGAVGALNADLDVFFATVRGPDFTGDPRIRYDRLSGRWFVTCITDALTNTPILLAVSNTGTINGSTAWTFYSFQTNTVPPAGDAGSSADYETLGIDANALYVGVTIFDFIEGFAGSTAFVIRKSSVLNGGPIVVTAFRNLTGGDSFGTGPGVPHGVDNYDPAATEGYFIGTDNASFGTLILRRVSNPGGTPSISGNIAITVPETDLPIPVPHKGNNDPFSGKLDSLDDRLMAAHLRNGHLWTSHTIGVDNTGSSAGTVTRCGSRWYDIANLSGTPVVVQSGTVFTANTFNVTTDRHYWIPTIMVSGQGHAAMGFSTAGTNEYINAATVGRLATDPSGTMQTPVLYTNSTTTYNPFGDDGSPDGVRRWGDYSMTTVDPSDDMTMWTVQEFCNAANSYGVRVVKLHAPPPATPTSCSPSTVFPGTTNASVVLIGTSSSGSGFFDPGAGFTKRLTASVSGTGVTVNSVTYTDATLITLNITVAASATFDTRTITVTNPDSQTATSATGLLTVAPSTNAFLSNLAVSVGTLNPAFARGTTSYTDSVSNATTSITVTPTVVNAAATVTVNTVPVASGTPSGAIPLEVGPNTIDTVVTAQDGTTKKTYRVVVTRLAVPPTVTTLAASAVSFDGATLNGMVDPNGLATTAHFEYGLTTTYGTSTANQNVGAGNSAVPVQATCSNLTSNTIYHCRLVATNSRGTAHGVDRTFTTRDNAELVGTWAERTVARSLPAAVGRKVDIGTLTFNGGTGTIEAAVNAGGPGWSVAKRYLIPIRFNLGNGSPPGTWLKVLPTHDTGPYGVNDFDLDVNVSDATVLLRLRTVGSNGNAATARIAIKTTGLQSFTNSAATAAAAVPSQTVGGNAVDELRGQGGVGVPPSGNAVIDVNGGDTRGLRLRPRSTPGAPATGKWSKGTMILDSGANLFICTAPGTPGTWKKVGGP
jgi:hypothetical protein